jgi:hypothetical protein
MVFKISGQDMAKFYQNLDLGRKVESTKFLMTVVTHKLLTMWSRNMDHQKAERVSYCNDIQDFQIFGQSETQKLSSVQPLLCPEIEISSEVDLQNSVTSTPFGGQRCMSNG